MNVRHPFPEQPISGPPAEQPHPPSTLDMDSAPMPVAGPTRHLHRQRDFGIGYGNSSGYGSELHYVDGHVDPIFRFV